MGFIQVASELQDGIREISEQHQRMLQYHKDMEQLIARGEEDRAALEAVLEGLIEYTITCFSFEENLMKISRYGKANDHQRSHDMFMRRLSGYRSSLQNGKYVANELMSMLTIWVNGHIKSQDMEFIDDVLKLARMAA